MIRSTSINIKNYDKIKSIEKLIFLIYTIHNFIYIGEHKMLRNYIYIDENSINGLYNQLYDNVLEETVSVQKKHENEIKGSVGTSGIMKSVVNIEGNYDLTLDSQKTSEKKIVLTLEKKVNALITVVSDNKCEYIKYILDENHPLEDSLIFVGKALFTLTALYDKEGMKTELHNYLMEYYTQNPSLVLESGTTSHVKKYSYHESDKYYNLMRYEKMKYGLSMHMGGDKIRQSIRHLTHNIEFGKKFMFNVFGELYSNGSVSYSIKPFAIWR